MSSESLELKIEGIDNKKIEDEVLAEGAEKVTEEKVEKSLNYDLLTDAEKRAIDEFCGKLDITDTTQILQYGSSAQSNISKFSDDVLQDVKTRSTGEVGDLLAELVSNIKEFDGSVPDSLNAKGIYGLFFSAKKQIEKIIIKERKLWKN